MLFADVTGSTRLYEAAGDRKALESIGTCIELLRRAAEAAGGRVLKTMGDGVMALFSSPDYAADASTRMHFAVNALPPIGGHKLGVRIGFHAGPVIQRDNDVFGDTVNLASRLVEQANSGQVLTSAATVVLLAPIVRNSTRRLYDITVKGKVEEVALCELLWRKSPDVTDVPIDHSVSRYARVTLRLKYRGKEFFYRRMQESISVGRDAGCALVVLDAKASRQHCVIERRQDKFFVRDHSANGTYLTVEGESEIALRREELTLRGHGWLAFGQRKADSADLVEYWFE